MLWLSIQWIKDINNFRHITTAYIRYQSQDMIEPLFVCRGIVSFRKELVG